MWRRATIANAETLSDTEVWEYKLPTSGILSAVLLNIENTNGGTDNVLNPIYKNINSIQLRDGGKVLLDISGVQAEYISLLASGGVARSRFSEVAGIVQSYQVLIPFGLRLFDNDFGLDLGALKNPILRVDLDFTNTRVAGATGFLTGNGRMSGVIFINDGDAQPTPAAYLKSHEIKNWTTAASGDETTQAPVDAPWARLIIRAHVAGSLPHAVLTDIKVSFDSGQLVALDEVTAWQANALPLMLGRNPRLDFDVFRLDAETLDLEHAGSVNYTANGDTSIDVMSLTGHLHGNVLTSDIVATTGADSAVDQTWAIALWPTMPFMSMFYDFIEMGMLDAAKYQRADIVLTQNMINAAASIVLQQVVPNA